MFISTLSLPSMSKLPNFAAVGFHLWARGACAVCKLAVSILQLCMVLCNLNHVNFRFKIFVDTVHCQTLHWKTTSRRRWSWGYRLLLPRPQEEKNQWFKVWIFQWSWRRPGESTSSSSWPDTSVGVVGDSLAAAWDDSRSPKLSQWRLMFAMFLYKDRLVHDGDEDMEDDNVNIMDSMENKASAGERFQNPNESKCDFLTLVKMWENSMKFYVRLDICPMSLYSKFQLIWWSGTFQPVFFKFWVILHCKTVKIICS